MSGLPGVSDRDAGLGATIRGFVVRDGRVTAIDVLADSERIAKLDLGALRSDH
jgi:hypothetical protein